MSDLVMPQPGTAAYEQLLRETDGAAANPGFNYAAHVAATGGSSQPAPAPNPPQPTYDSRFTSLDDALAYAESHGQGQLTIAADGTITNRFGEVMVYDSDGNLAPKPGSMPGSTPTAPTAPAAPPTTTPVIYNSRFNTLEDAIAYAESHGQGQLTIASDGTITNRFGEVMVYDSDGNLAPKPGSMPTANPGTNVAPTSPVTNPGNGQTGNTGSQGYVPLPEFGSAAYKALLLETGRSDLIGFNYAAHLAVKTEASLPNFEQYFNAASGTDLVTLLGSVDVNQLMAKASSTQVQQLVSKFSNDPAFARYLDIKTEVQIPAAGSAAYDNLLRQTGRTDLNNFDYSAHIRAITQAEESVRKIGLGQQFSEAQIRYANALNVTPKEGDTPETTTTSAQDSLVIIGSDQDDVIIGTSGKDVLIAGRGNDELNGGSGVDHAVLETAGAAAQLIRANNDQWQITAGTETKQLVDVERVHFNNESLALDLGMNEPAGQTVLLIGAVFGAPQVDNASYVGIGLNLLDGGTSYADLADLAVRAAGLSTPEQLVGTLWQNVVGSPASAADMAPFIAMLENGMPVHQLVALAAETELNQTKVDLTGLSSTGIDYVAP